MNSGGGSGGKLCFPSENYKVSPDSSLAASELRATASIHRESFVITKCKLLENIRKTAATTTKREGGKEGGRAGGRRKRKKMEKKRISYLLYRGTKPEVFPLAKEAIARNDVTNKQAKRAITCRRDLWTVKRERQQFMISRFLSKRF